MNISSVFTSWITSKRLNFRNKALSRSHHDLETFRCSEVKPPKVTSRALTLFYRPKSFWFAMQVVFFVALALWTVKGYVHFIKSL